MHKAALYRLLGYIRQQRHQTHNHIVPVKPERLAPAHEVLIRKQCLYLYDIRALEDGVLCMLPPVMCVDDRAADRELLVVSQCARREAGHVYVKVEDADVRVVACVVSGDREEPKTFAHVYFK